MLADMYYRIDPIVSFKIYNVVVVLVIIVMVTCRSQRLSALWFVLPLLVMADSSVPWLNGLLYWCVLEPNMPTRSALFATDLICNIVVSSILTGSCIVLYRQCGKRPS
ncbi:MAG: hypothetical protein JSU63_17720 [Phycisphaerales bacterium]|nr:MAG: hypothetical protein JSU63_17720 [Phycisphaerales bacterium]